MLLSFIVYIIIGEKKLLRTNNLDGGGKGGMRKDGRRWRKGGKTWREVRRKDGVAAMEKGLKGVGWARRVIVEKMGR